jgi:hypothetical protein
MEESNRFMSKGNSQKPEDEKQRPDSSALSRVTPKRKLRARLTCRDAEDMASLIAMRLSETEACAKLNIPRRTWVDWKARHQEDFAVVLDRIKGERIAAHLKNIENFSAKDWRASECYLEKTEPSRFASRALAFPQEPSTTINVHNNFLMMLAAERIYGKDALKPPAPAPKALPEPQQAALKDNVATMLEVLPKDSRKP